MLLFIIQLAYMAKKMEKACQVRFLTP